MPGRLRGRAEVARLRSDLDRLFARYDDLPVEATELRADFANYLCVRVTGFVERAVMALVVEFTRGRSAPELVRYVERDMNRFHNPGSERLRQLLGAFVSGWSDALTDFLDKEGRGDALNSLIGLRNRIAHGDPSTGLTYARIDGYHVKIGEVVDFVSDLLLPE